MQSSRAFSSSLLLLTCLLTLPHVAWAAPIVGAVNGNPSTIQVNVPTSVNVTAVITDPTLISATLQRLNTNGTVTNLGDVRDDGAGGDAAAGDRVFTFVTTFNESQTGKIRLRVSAAFRGQLRRVFSQELAAPSR